ncbi:electrogenic sodium bicarbonate cotransporter 4-like [Archocentrus centrarchus]|uniref:electrogenic sodium bicarbonate cotransporter 4-like n=1 Tax=Archocentrus centrarchus TaxID=63155 RepID=UPI0011E9B4F2|nr:electrogenic sodium bicarbonate cotransporter 4-like [Archocentrus centrarchus]
MDQQISAVIVNRTEHKPIVLGQDKVVHDAFHYLRHVPLRRVHLFTLIQITCLAVLWVFKSTFLAIIFPVMILGLMVVRKMLDMVFSQHDLAWLDDLLPEKDRMMTRRRRKRSPNLMIERKR